MAEAVHPETRPRSLGAVAWLGIAIAAFVGVAGFLHSYDPTSGANERTNILLLGIGGEGHAGGNLADSIMIASIQGDEAVLLSIPRDLYIDIHGIRTGRINAAHAIGESRYHDGIGLMRTTLEETLGIAIHHYVRVDFQGFISTIDAVGGIPVRLQQPIYDTHFEKEYGIIDYAAGEHQLDGRDALYLARSRKTSARGDCDRAARQRAILMGARDRLLSLDILTNPTAISTVFEAAGTHLRSSLSLYDTWAMYHRTRAVRRIESIGLGDVNGLLTPRTIDGAQVLVPASEDLAAIRHFVGDLLRG